MSKPARQPFLAASFSLILSRVADIDSTAEKSSVLE